MTTAGLCIAWLQKPACHAAFSGLVSPEDCTGNFPCRQSWMEMNVGFCDLAGFCPPDFVRLTACQGTVILKAIRISGVVSLIVSVTSADRYLTPFVR